MRPPSERTTNPRFAWMLPGNVTTPFRAWRSRAVRLQLVAQRHRMIGSHRTRRSCPCPRCQASRGWPRRCNARWSLRIGPAEHRHHPALGALGVSGNLGSSLAHAVLELGRPCFLVGFPMSSTGRSSRPPVVLARLGKLASYCTSTTARAITRRRARFCPASCAIFDAQC